MTLISHRPERIATILLIPIISFLYGCSPEPPHLSDPPAPKTRTTDAASQSSEPRGLILLLPGIEGGRWAMGDALRGVRDAGLNADVRIEEWGIMLGGLANLMLREHNREEAQRIAREITTWAREHPGSPIQLAGYSGGGGIAVMVAEVLPADVRLQNIILVQCAVSRDYDLTRALSHVNGRIINLYSPHDAVVLGAGTSV